MIFEMLLCIGIPLLFLAVAESVWLLAMEKLSFVVISHTVGKKQKPKMSDKFDLRVFWFLMLLFFCAFFIWTFTLHKIYGNIEFYEAPIYLFLLLDRAFRQELFVWVVLPISFGMNLCYGYYGVFWERIAVSKNRWIAALIFALFTTPYWLEFFDWVASWQFTGAVI